MRRRSWYASEPSSDPGSGCLLRVTQPRSRLVASLGNLLCVWRSELASVCLVAVQGRGRPFLDALSVLEPWADSAGAAACTRNVKGRGGREAGVFERLWGRPPPISKARLQASPGLVHHDLGSARSARRRIGSGSRLSFWEGLLLAEVLLGERNASPSWSSTAAIRIFATHLFTTLCRSSQLPAQ